VPSETSRRIHYSSTGSVDRVYKMSNVNGSEATKAGLKLGRNSTVIVFGNYIKLLLSLWYVKTLPCDPTALTSFQ